MGKAGDQTANQFLIHAIAQQRPDDGLLSAESKDTQERLGKSRVWIIHPVDGTREYDEARPEWDVHIPHGHTGLTTVAAVPLHGPGLTLRSVPPLSIPVLYTPLPRKN